MSAKTYKRMSKDEVEVGNVFKGRGEAIVDQDVEDILEDARPAGALSRIECTYMREDEDFSMMGLPYTYGYVNEVEPVGDVQKHDVAWLGAIQKRRIKDPRFKKDLYPGVTDKELAERYWSGEPTEKPDWEYVAKEARTVTAGTTLQHKNPNSIEAMAAKITGDKKDPAS